MERIGVAAVEDDGIYFTVAQADAWEIGRVERPEVAPRPPGGYTWEFVARTIRQHFEGMVSKGELRGIGISMFGLIDLEEKTLLEVPRFDWVAEGPARLDFRTLFAGVADCPVYVGHDSSTFAVGEWWKLTHQAGVDLPEAFVSVRVGAGVGVGCVNRNGTVRAGRSHPEAGHLLVMRRESDRIGTCRAHSREGWDCVEGLVSEKAILARGDDARRLIDIPSNHVVWGPVAAYLAQLCVAVTALIAPDMIVIGGRTMIGRNGKLREPVLRKIRDAFKEMIGGYPRYQKTRDVNSYIRGALSVPNPASASLAGVAELTRREVFRVIEGGGAVEFPAAAPAIGAG